MKKQRTTRANFDSALTASLIFNIVATALILFLVVTLNEYTTRADRYYNKSVELEALTESLLDSNSQLCDRIDELDEALATYAGDIVVNATAPPRYFDVPLDEDLQDYIWTLCCDYGISDKYELVYAVIKKESSFHPDSISATDDYGLMQINVSNHTWLSSRLGATDFLDPYQNVHCGIYMLASLLHKYETTDALMIYNMGSRGAIPLWECGIHSTNYTDIVMKYYKQFTENI